MTTLKQGVKAPDIELTTDDGGEFRLSDHRGRNVLLYFYPQADTPGCTSENVDFTRLAEQFAEREVVLVGISPDGAEKLAKFREKYALSPILVSDPERVAIAAYGAWGEKKNYGKTYEGLIRTTVLVGKDGDIVRIWPNVRAKGHAEKVLRELP